jgi:hypothetical protein
MRVLCAGAFALLLSACAIGPEVASVTELQGVTAQQIDEDVEPSKIRIANIYAILFTNHWTAMTPSGQVYECTRDLAEDACKKSRW